MSLSFQIQLGGTGNVQIFQQCEVSYPRLLNQILERISAREFVSTDVKAHFIEVLKNMIGSFNEKKAEVYESSKYIKFPFQLLPEPEIFNNSNFFESLAEAFTVLVFSDARFEVRDHRLCLKVNRKHYVGIYFQEGAGSYTLKENYIMLLNEMENKKELLPQDFLCVILFPKGTESSLDGDKMKSVVTNIMGAKTYIRPIAQGKPKCFNLTSYIVNDAQSVHEAKEKIKGVLNLD